VKEGSGRIYAQGSIPATRLTLDMWMKTLPQPWTAAMEATIFTAWIYDHLQPHAAAAVKVAHPLMLRAIAVAKKKNDRIDAKKIADCLRCDFLAKCYMASTEIRERRRTLRYRNLLVRQTVQMKNKIAVLLMEAGVSYNKQKLHKVGYFRELLSTNQDIDEGLKPLLRLCREMVVRLGKTESALVRSLQRDSLLVERVERLMTIPAVGPITAQISHGVVSNIALQSTIEHYPSGSVVAGVFLTANPSVYTPVHESIAHCGREKEMIQPHPLV